MTVGAIWVGSHLATPLSLGMPAGSHLAAPLHVGVSFLGQRWVCMLVFASSVLNVELLRACSNSAICFKIVITNFSRSFYVICAFSVFIGFVRSASSLLCAVGECWNRTFLFSPSLPYFLSLCSNKECPTCRKKLVSKRSLRADPNFDKLISKVYLFNAK